MNSTATLTQPPQSIARVPLSTRNHAQQAPVAQPLAQPHVAVVLSTSGHRMAGLLPVLAGLGITTIDRAFDEEAAGIIASIRPELTIVVCDPADSAVERMLGTIAAEHLPRLLIVDIGRSPGGAVAALDLGADATLSVMDDASVVRATLVALLRRSDREATTNAANMAATAEQVTVAELTVDHGTFEVRDGGELVPLTPTEFRIVAHLADHAGKVRSGVEIMSAIHDYPYDDYDAQRSVKVYVRRIRRKLAACLSPSVEVVNARTFGYQLRSVAGHATTA